MKWIKSGQVFCAAGESPSMQSGGRVPLALHLQDDTFRVFFATYDANGRGRIFSGELDLNDPTSLTNLVTDPLVDLGEFGTFDDNGVIPSCIVETDEGLYLYTSGFSVKNQLIFDSAGGLAVSHDRGSTFTKSNGPILDRGLDDPCFATSPWVAREADAWHMWHVSCDRWTQDGTSSRHHYNIKHKWSSDGKYWEPRSTVCIDYQSDLEYAIARPTVVRLDNGTYRMWYCFREQAGVSTYRIGYASSDDGLAWRRRDSEVGIDVSESGWDSEMICYPCVFRHKDTYFMLYNGNGYGRTGFGLARLEGSL